MKCVKRSGFVMKLERRSSLHALHLLRLCVMHQLHLSPPAVVSAYSARLPLRLLRLLFKLLCRLKQMSRCPMMMTMNHSDRQGVYSYCNYETTLL